MLSDKSVLFTMVFAYSEYFSFSKLNFENWWHRQDSNLREQSSIDL